jgi:hypothetical protein
MCYYYCYRAVIYSAHTAAQMSSVYDHRLLLPCSCRHCCCSYYCCYLCFAYIYCVYALSFAAHLHALILSTTRHCTSDGATTIYLCMHHIVQHTSSVMSWYHSSDDCTAIKIAYSLLSAHQRCATQVQHVNAVLVAASA